MLRIIISFAHTLYYVFIKLEIINNKVIIVNLINEQKINKYIC